MTTPTATKPGSAPQAPPRPFPFPVGVYDAESQDGGQMSLVQTAAAQQFPIYNVSPTGWVRGIWCDVAMIVSGNVTNNVSYSKDNPFSAIQKITLRDLGQQAIIGPLAGYDWMVLNKLGGYQSVGDPRADITFTATTGTGSSGGSFTFSLYLPFEFVQRDGLGVAENQSKPGWTVEVFMDSQANTYNQVPSVFGTMSLTWYPVSYTKPIAAAPSGRPFMQAPPKAGTLQFWRSENQAMPASASQYDLVNGVGFPIRNIIYKTVDTSAGTRAAGDADFPNPATLQYGNVIQFAKTRLRWESEMGRVFGWFNTTPDTALARENAVYAWWRTQDFALEAGNELRYRYLDTATNTLVRLSGTFAATSTLFALTNWIAPVNKDYYSLIGG